MTLAGPAGGGTTTSSAPDSGTSTAPTSPPSGQPPAASGAAGSTPPPAAPAPNPNLPAWAADPTAGVDEEARNYVSLKKYATPGDVVKALIHSEKFIGAPSSELIRIGKEGLPPEELRSLQTRLGLPEKPDGYGITAAEGEDPAFATTMSGVFHKHGLTEAQGKGVAEDFNAYADAQRAAVKQAHDAKLASAEEALKGEWAGQYEPRKQMVQQMAPQLGFTPEIMAGIQARVGPAGLLKFLWGFQKFLGEERFTLSTAPARNGGMDPGQGKARIAELKADHKFVEALTTGTLTAEQQRAWDEAHKAAFPAPGATS